MKKPYLIALLFFALLFSSCRAFFQTEKLPENAKTITLKSPDGVTFLADFYPAKSKNAPIIILCHQALYSRGSYREIAPKLQQQGFHCLAIDQRSGLQCNGVKNSAHKSAKKLNLPTKYPDALPDVLTAINYAKQQFPNQKVILWGSSYSAALTFIIANQTKLNGILAFSPGEYFSFKGKSISEYASKITIPTFITSSPSEVNKSKPLFNAVSSTKKTHFIPKGSGKHGSKTLWNSTNNHQEYWDSVNQFLNTYFPR